MRTNHRRPIAASSSLVVLLLTVAGCASFLEQYRPKPFAPPPVGVREVAVATPTNKTKTSLVVNDPGLLTGYLEGKSTVPELLEADLRRFLVVRGYRVERVGKDAPRLQVEIRRWEHYSADFSMVTVDLTATLEGSSGKLWSVERTDWKVPTPGSGSAIEASNAAAEAIAAALLEGWEAGAAK